MLAASSRAAAVGREPGEVRAEFLQALLGNVDRDLLVLRGGGF
jgi:hypothetical protein